jgi:transcriptional accessory protein Tex/SPT6
MANQTEQKISINTATPKQLTQLPGIAKDTAYRLVNHRKRHGFFTHWEELAEVREFPVEKIDEIRKRATLKCPPGEDCVGPRRMKPTTVERVAKKPRGYTKAKRTTRRPGRLGRAA